MTPNDRSGGAPLRRVRLALSGFLVAAIAVGALVPAGMVLGIRDTQTRYAGTNCVVTGKSFSGTDSATLWGLAGETDGSQCTAYRLSGYWECDDGYSGTLGETWYSYGFSHIHLCGYPYVRISTHLHDACEYGNCAGTFSTYVQEW